LENVGAGLKTLRQLPITMRWDSTNSKTCSSWCYFSAWAWSVSP